MPTVNPFTLSLKEIVNVVVEVSPLAAPRRTFNQLLVLGPTAIVPVNTRVAIYTSTSAMLGDGFQNSDPEYKVAELYFSQRPAPTYLYVGRIDADSGETILQALQACRSANWEWYVCMATEASSEDHKEIALWVESVQPSSVYVYTTSDTDVPDGTPGNIFEYLKGLGYSRTYGQYSTTQDNTHPNNIYAVAAIMGYAMGQNTGAANSAYTLKFKGEVGISTEPVTVTQKAAIEGNNGNLYLSYGNYYNTNGQGVMADGQFFDEIINLDMLANDIQLNIMDLLYQNPKIPQTDAGVTQLIHAVNRACDLALYRGFLAPGTWTGGDVMNLTYGDAMPKGYIVQAQSVAEQAQADREARKAPPMYVAIKEAGAIHSCLITVYVNR